MNVFVLLVFMLMLVSQVFSLASATFVLMLMLMLMLMFESKSKPGYKRLTYLITLYSRRAWGTALALYALKINENLSRPSLNLEDEALNALSKLRLGKG